MLVEIKGMINLGTLKQHVFALAAGVTLFGDVLIIIISLVSPYKWHYLLNSRKLFVLCQYMRFGPIYTYVILLIGLIENSMLPPP